MARGEDRAHAGQDHARAVEQVHPAPEFTDQSGDVDVIVKRNREEVGRGGVLEFLALDEDARVRREMVLPGMIQVDVRVDRCCRFARGRWR